MEQQRKLSFSEMREMILFARSEGVDKSDVCYDEYNETAALSNDCITAYNCEGDVIVVNVNDTKNVDNDYYTDDCDNIVWDEIYREYIHMDDAVRVYVYGSINSVLAKRGDYYIIVNEEFYQDFYAANYHGLYRCVECDNWSDDRCCWDCNNEKVENEGYLFEYHSDNRCDKSKDSQFKIGFEVEKEDESVFETDYAEELFNTTGWAKEKDSSLGDGGYELVSPIFNLMDNDAITRSILEVDELVNAKFSNRCGGHINISDSDKTPCEMLRAIGAYMPLLYAIYPKRLTNTYCKAKKLERLFSDADKYQAIAIKSNRLEIRIFPAVRSVRNLLWRAELVRIMIAGYGKTYEQILKDMIDNTSALHGHLRDIYTINEINDRAAKYKKYVSEIEEIELIQSIYSNEFFSEELELA